MSFQQQLIRFFYSFPLSFNIRLSADTNQNRQVAYSELPSGRGSDWVGLTLEINMTICICEIRQIANCVITAQSSACVLPLAYLHISSYHPINRCELLQLCCVPSISGLVSSKLAHKHSQTGLNRLQLFCQVIPIACIFFLMENKNINFFFLKNSTETSNILLGTFSSEFLGLILINLIFAILIIFFLIKRTAVNQT